MAKKQTFGDKAAKGQAKSKQDYNFFGTRQDMIVKEVLNGEEVVKLFAKDDKGVYVTYPEYVDSGLADPNRYAGDRDPAVKEELEKIEAGEKAQEEATAAKAAEAKVKEEEEKKAVEEAPAVEGKTEEVKEEAPAAAEKAEEVKEEVPAVEEKAEEEKIDDKKE